MAISQKSPLEAVGFLGGYCSWHLVARRGCKLIPNSSPSGDKLAYYSPRCNFQFFAVESILLSKVAIGLYGQIFMLWLQVATGVFNLAIDKVRFPDAGIHFDRPFYFSRGDRKHAYGGCLHDLAARLAVVDR